MLISVLSFQLVEESVNGGGLVAMVAGFACGAVVFISNVPEGLSNTAGMKRSGRSAGYVFAVWGGIAVLSGLSALAGVLFLQNAGGALIAFITAVAAGAILAMLADTMIPEAFEGSHMLTGLLTAAGFLAAFIIDYAGG